MREKARPVLDRAAFGVGRAEVEPPQPRQRNGRRAHGAGFERDVEVAPDKPLGGQGAAGLANGKNFGVRRRIVIGEHAVAGGGQHGAGLRHAGADREVRARSVIVATPAFVTREIVRGLPRETADALDAVRYGPYIVGAFLTGETGPMPWDRLYALATPTRSFSMLFNTANVLRGSPRRGDGGSLMVYAAANGARALAEKDDAQVQQLFLSDLAGLYPEAREVVREVVIQRWERGLPYAAVGRAPGAVRDAL